MVQARIMAFKLHLHWLDQHLLFSNDEPAWFNIEKYESENNTSRFHNF